MKKKLGRVAVSLLLTTTILTVNVLASSDVKVSKNAGDYGKLYGILYGGAAMDFGYEFTHDTHVTKRPAGNFYVKTSLEIQNTKNGKTLTKDYEKGLNREKKVQYYYQLDHINGVDYKKTSFTVFGAHEVDGSKGNFVCYSKNVYKYSEDHR